MTTNVEQKPGYKTTQFWFALVASLWGAFVASGVIATDNPWVQTIGAIVVAVTSSAYSVSRGMVKK